MHTTHFKAVLIATLGSEPQVITSALDLLLQQREPIQRVEVVHTVAPGSAIATALDVLQHELSDLPGERGIPLVLYPIRDLQGRPLPDVETYPAAQAACRILYRLVQTAKRNGERVHLSIAGGRKTLAVFGMVVAQMLFDDEDCLWHLYSAGDFLQSKRLHPQSGDDVHLISIPVILWGDVSPIFTILGETEDPFDAAKIIHQQKLNQKLEQGRSFVLGSLTPSEARVVVLLVREGLSDAEIAARLVISPRTVGEHLGAAYQKAAAHWDLADVNRAQLVSLLSVYYTFQNS